MLVSQGRDTYCIDALEPGRMARGVTLVAQRCYHRLITPRGALRGGQDEANFGMDLAGLVGSTETTDLAYRLPVAIRNEILKDPAVTDVEVNASRTAAGGSVSWTIEVVISTTEEDVTLIVGVDDVSVKLLGVR